MSVEKFISAFVACPNRDSTWGTGYLAQHRLFDQVPELLRDIVTPDYCALLTAEDENEDGGEAGAGVGAGEDGPSACSSKRTAGGADAVLVNAWLGPSTTVSPLHHDPYHNLLAQVVGYKYVRLYHPSASKYLYPMAGRMSNNR